MELRNPIKGIGFGWSLTGYAQLRVGLTSLSRFAPAYRIVGNQGSTVLSLKSFKWVYKSFRMLSKKNVHDFTWLDLKNIRPARLLSLSFLFPVVTRSGRFAGRDKSGPGSWTCAPHGPT